MKSQAYRKWATSGVSAETFKTSAGKVCTFRIQQKAPVLHRIAITMHLRQATTPLRHAQGCLRELCNSFTTPGAFVTLPVCNDHRVPSALRHGALRMVTRVD